MKRFALALLLAALPLLGQDKFSLENKVSPKPSGTAGDIPYAVNTTTIGWIAHATGTKCLTQTDAAAPTWGACGGGSPLTTKGDLHGFSTDNLDARVPVGTDGQGLVADSTQPLGIKWASISGSGTVTSIVVSAPLTGGTITTTGTIACPPAVASGASHASGCVPDPGVTAGETKFLREDMTYVAPSGSGGGYAGTLWIGADPNFSVPAGYERQSNSYRGGAPGLVQLKAGPTWTNTVADAKTNPPVGWTYNNTTHVVAADENTTTANGFYLSWDVTNNYNWLGSEQTASILYKTYPALHQEWILRIASSAYTTGAKGSGFILHSTSLATAYWRVIMQGLSATVGELIFFDGVMNVTVATTQTQNTNGVWIKVVRMGPQVAGYYNLANQATPPTTWTAVGAATSILVNAPEIRAGWVAARFNSTGASNLSVLYFDDQRSNSVANWEEATYPLINAVGFDSASPVLTLVSGIDLGATGATVTDANVQAALTEITNPREWDSAAWTWSVSRGAAAPVTCGGGTYAAAASVTVGGTGRYLSVCGKAASTGNVLPASVNAVALRIPFTP